ncbi:phospho-N-acetylmuramoyl-pentapeptide-transferase [Streptococcus didelphis]|uniref:Phospho-N-acetylmuramoyl-pentapeptide-transferase n=1 Tax=Streptococcus didelphis TaxID=102886 RepID=A0ABY9LIC2_9STRE|nr:phospho-N-acetylmuramoyl-pentapeptide-transferase [Streptococcus didelphis]WMB28610.1 phospho-N-acetylmuramoyl-pentapeptide-transferase [Streptococcus didelphis]
MFLTLTAGLIALLLTALVMPYFINFYQIKKISGQQMHEDVKQHIAKAGTPTMGGTVFLLVSTVIAIIYGLLFFHQAGSFGLISGILAILIIYGLIGFLDDFLKIFKQINEGLTPKQKLALQIVGGLIFYFLHVAPNGIDAVNVLGYPIHLGIFYIFFVLFWTVGFSNAVNLTDGIDGLASISVVISLITYGIIAFKQGQYDLLMLIGAVIGSLLGFFLFNHKPAKVFMGDVGSLALGALLAAISIALRQEWTLLVIGIVYVFETSSVMLQVAYFKYTKKKFGQGHRIFRMTPFHHHLELGGLSGKAKAWSEWKVDSFLWAVGSIASLLVLAFLYL